MKQTAVEWLVEKMLSQDWYTYKSLEYIEQAKEMEKQQTIDFTDKYILECLSCNYDGDPISLKETEQYYKETFKKD